MAKRLIQIEFGYKYCVEDKILIGSQDKIIADFRNMAWALSLNLDEINDAQIRELCRPVIDAHKKGIHRGKAQFVTRLMSLFDFKCEVLDE